MRCLACSELMTKDELDFGDDFCFKCYESYQECWNELTQEQNKDEENNDSNSSY